MGKKLNVTWFRGSGPGAGPIIMGHSENVKKYFTIIEDKLKAPL